MPAWATIALGVVGLTGVCSWLWRSHGRTAALVAAGLGVAALTVLAISYSPIDVEGWRRGHLDRTLLLFALPAAAAIVIALVRSKGRLPWRSSILVTCLWLGPSLLIWGSQLQPFPAALPSGDPAVANLLWFAGWTIAVYLLIPVTYARVCGQRIRSYGLSAVLLKREWIIFGLAVPVLLAAVWFFSAEERFAQTYPFLRDPASWQQLLLWEVAYGATFIALEFFFRGFLVFAGQPVLGIHAIPVMAFSYCLIHLAKPMPEAVSSLIGGLVLGYLALRFRSILVGVAAHLTIAWGMDASVLARR